MDKENGLTFPHSIRIKINDANLDFPVAVALEEQGVIVEKKADIDPSTSPTPWALKIEGDKAFDGYQATVTFPDPKTLMDFNNHPIRKNGAKE